jgi:signal transduction histidine kinase
MHAAPVLTSDPTSRLRQIVARRLARRRDEGLLLDEIARLRVEVRVKVAELEASRGRIVAAADAERHKLERDLHDGAQQRLVGLGLALRQAQGQLAADPAGARDTLDRAVGEVATAIAELRAMARGLRPGILDSGLAGALSDIARRSPVPVALEITREPIDPHLEATAFFLACESVTNAIKHAGARHIRIRVDRLGEQLHVEVGDDGVGGATLRAGGGLAGMTLRALAGGGLLDVHSPPGGGTTIRAELPVCMA